MSRRHATPWGPADIDRTIGPGIISYSSDSHGGIHVEAAAMRTMPAGLARFEPFAGFGWYEEDRDWSIVALAWPDLFPPGAVAAAVDTVRIETRGGFELGIPAAAKWLDTDEGARALAIAAAWKEQNADNFRVGISGSIPKRHEPLAARLGGNLSWACMRRIRDGKEAEALLRYSDMRGGVINLADIPDEQIIRRPA